MLNIRLPFREEIIAIVDIGPGSARAALISLNSSGVHVHVQTYSLISIETETPEHSIATIADRVDDVCKRLLERGALKGITGHIKSVYCVVHAPWSHSTTARKRIDFDTETRIHESHISAVAKDILADMKSLNREALMETAVIRTWLNGYPVEHPEGKPAHSLVVSAIVSEIDQTVQKNAEAAIHRAFPSSVIEWRSAARVMQVTLGSLYREDENYLAIDMGMDATHLISIRDGFPVAERIVPHGLRTILARVDTTRVAEETLGLIRMLSRDACEGSACEAIRKSMALAEPELAKIFGECFGGLAVERRLANTLILSASPDMVDWMKLFFSRLDFTQFTATTLPFAVSVLESGSGRPPVVAEESLHSQIVFAAALVNMERRS